MASSLKCSQLSQSSRAFYSLSKQKETKEKKKRYLEFIASLLTLLMFYRIQKGEKRNIEMIRQLPYKHCIWSRILT